MSGKKIIAGLQEAALVAPYIARIEQLEELHRKNAATMQYAALRFEERGMSASELRCAIGETCDALDARNSVICAPQQNSLSANSEGDA